MGGFTLIDSVLCLMGFVVSEWIGWRGLGRCVGGEGRKRAVGERMGWEMFSFWAWDEDEDGIKELWESVLLNLHIYSRDDVLVYRTGAGASIWRR